MGLQNIEDISLKGFIVVKHEFFKQERTPAMTVFRRKVSFGKECQLALGKCQSVQMMINFDSRQIIVRPMSSSEEDTIVWYKEDLKNPFVGDFACTPLMARVFREWGLDPRYRYKTKGRIVKSDRKLMLMFDFNEADTYDGIKLVRRHE